MKYQYFISNLKKRISPFYLFEGEEDLLKEEALEEAASLLLEPENRIFDLNIFYGDEASGLEIASQASTLPFLSKKRLVVVKDAGALKKSDREELLTYARDPSPASCLILLIDRLDGGFAKIVRYGEVVSFPSLTDYQLIGWIIDRVKKEGKWFSRQAAFLLREKVRGDLRTINNELVKLISYLGERTKIEPDDVKAVVGESRENTVFDLTDSIGERDGERALKILQRLMREGTRAPAIIGALVWQMRRIFRAKERVRRGASLREALRSLKVPYFSAKKFTAIMENFTSEDLVRSFRLLLKADVDSKLRGLDRELLLQLLVVELCEPIHLKGEP